MSDLLILVPYRNREVHLRSFLREVPTYLDSFMPGPPLSYQIAVVEQHGDDPFNRGKLFNAAVRDLGLSAATVCLHDVDMLPLDVDYHPAERPVHLAGCASQNNFTLPYPSWIGGVMLVPLAAYWAVNGFSNEYWGYGREDDEFEKRLRESGVGYSRRAGRFQSLPHAKGRTGLRNAKRYEAFRTQQYDRLDDGIKQSRFRVLKQYPLRDVLGMQDVAERHIMLTVDLQFPG